jgi:solute:Na+ symporter, SSS family
VSHFNWCIDGSIIGLYLVATMIAGIMVRKYVGKVEHFLIAGREVNVYLGIASLAATEFGVVTCMYTAQNGYNYGFAGATPGVLQGLAMFLVGITGFCVKPLRDAGVMTIPELFERRFGPRIRWAAGVVIVLGGLLNMGVFLRITGEFLMLVCGFEMQYTKIVITMTILLLLGTIYTVAGGMLSVLITDFLQFIVMSAGLIAVTVLILCSPDVGWQRLAQGVSAHYAAGGFNPLAAAKLGWQFMLAQTLLMTAAVLTWQTTISRLLAAKDTKTGRQVYTRTSFFFVCRFLIPAVWGIAALVMLAPGDMAVLGPALKGNESLWAMPFFLSRFVPVGLMGLLLAAMLAADMSNTSSYMITWSTVIYNDIMAPFRKTAWSEKRGLLWNRVLVAAIGLFLLFYGLVYPLKGNVWDYLCHTGTIYLSSMSTLLIACCYWKRANNWGAAAAIVVGAAVPLTFLILKLVPGTEKIVQAIGEHNPVILAFLGTWVAMVAGSLLKPTVAVNPAVAVELAGDAR